MIKQNTTAMSAYSGEEVFVDVGLGPVAKVRPPASCHSSCFAKSDVLEESEASAKTAIANVLPDIDVAASARSQQQQEADYYAGTSFPRNGWIQPCA